MACKSARSLMKDYQIHQELLLRMGQNVLNMDLEHLSTFQTETFIRLSILRNYSSMGLIVGVTNKFEDKHKNHGHTIAT